MDQTTRDISDLDITGLSFKDKIYAAPESPGVYFWKDKNGKILYIGKAKVLKHRVRSYFSKESKGYRLDMMVALAANLDWVVTTSESEALILEDHLIKTHKPKFNIRQKDNKSYPYIRLTHKELFPRLMLTRNVEDKSSQYYGPYKSAFDARKTLAIIHKYFPLRKKNLELDGKKTFRPCLNYHMGRCLAPCTGKVSQEKYAELVQHVNKLLKGDYKDLITVLEKNMLEKSERFEFEDAAKIRDQIHAVHMTLKKRPAVNAGKINRDIIYIHEDLALTAVQFLFIRNGIVLSGDFFVFKNNQDLNANEIIRYIISKVYIGGKSIIPEEIVASHALESFEMLATYANERLKKNLTIHVPERGERKHLLNMCRKNAEENITLQFKQQETHEHVLSQTKQELRLNHVPEVIECFDISNISGTSTVASMTVFEHGQPAKKRYKRFKIKTIEGSNDFGAMAEVIERRMKRAQSDEWPLPHLMVIDGGIGQLNAVCKVLERYQTGNMDIIAIAKGRTEKRKTVGKNEESDYDYDYVLKPNQKNPIPLKKKSTAAHLIRNIRDEAHRFAITYHRQVRSQHSLGQILSQVDGIGTIKQRRLLKHFGGLTNIRHASEAQILEVKGISQKDVKNIAAYFDKMSEKI